MFTRQRNCFILKSETECNFDNVNLNLDNFLNNNEVAAAATPFELLIKMNRALNIQSLTFQETKFAKISLVNNECIPVLPNDLFLTSVILCEVNFIALNNLHQIASGVFHNCTNLKMISIISCTKLELINTPMCIDCPKLQFIIFDTLKSLSVIDVPHLIHGGRSSLQMTLSITQLENLVSLGDDGGSFIDGADSLNGVMYTDIIIKYTKLSIIDLGLFGRGTIKRSLKNLFLVNNFNLRQITYPKDGEDFCNVNELTIESNPQFDSQGLETIISLCPNITTISICGNLTNILPLNKTKYLNSINSSLILPNINNYNLLSKLELINMNLSDTVFTESILKFHLPNLVHIDLSNNSISLLHINCTTKQPLCCKVLNLSGNLIEQIPHKFFQCYFPKIASIYLNSNRLKSIENGVFSNLQHLSDIHLLNQSISYIKPYAFINSKNLKLLEFTNLNNIFDNVIFSGKPIIFDDNDEEAYYDDEDTDAAADDTNYEEFEPVDGGDVSDDDYELPLLIF